MPLVEDPPVMLLEPRVSASPALRERAGETRRPAGHPIAGRMVRAFLWSSVVCFAYVLANQIASPHNTLRESPATSIVLSALSLTLAVYAAIRNQADLLQKTRLQSARYQRAEAEKAGLAGAIEEASDAIVITDGDGAIQYVNGAFTRLTGYGAQEALGRNPRILKSGEQDPAFYKELWETIRKGKVWRGELTNRRKDGTLYKKDMTITPVRSTGGGISHYIAISHDLTERRAAEEARSFLASIVEFSEDAIIGATPQGAIVSWNRGAESLYGYPPEEAVGKPVSMLVPDDRQGDLRLLADKLERGESVGYFESAGVSKQGKRIDVSICMFPIKDAGGQIAAHAAIVRDITTRIQAQQAAALLASIVDSANDAIFGTALDGAVVSWNKGAEVMYGYPAAEILGKPVSALAPAGRFHEHRELLDRIREGETISQLETVRMKRDGSMMHVSLTISPIRNASGEVVGASTIARDIGDRKRAEEALRQSEEKYRLLAANLPDVVWVADAEGRPVFVSPNCKEMSGYTADEISQAGFWLERVHPQDYDRVDAAYRALFEKEEAFNAEFRFQRKDGNWIWLHVRAVNSHERDGKRYRDGLISDITGRKRMEQRLAHQATHDLLTGLPNRLVFEDRFQQAMARVRRHGGMLALLYLDLDRFKRINDTLGHQAGDSLLQSAARRLVGCLRESETLSRAGGDRFMLILTDVGGPQAAARVAERILGTLSAPFHVKGNEVFLSASIGIALFPQDGPDLASLQKAADSALYAAKRQGKHRFEMFTPELSIAASRRLAVESELHHALERDEVSLHYQPQFDLATNHIAGVEALLRWTNPKFGHMPVSDLIPIAEETGLIVPISARVLREACRQGKSWQEAGSPPIEVAVNTSAVQFAQGNLTEMVARALAETGLEASRLNLEVTESVLMQDIQESARQLTELKKLGVSVSLDDFGTGYSSLSYLEELPIDNLKIDRKFVRRMSDSGNSQTLVEAIVDLAHGLGMRAIAEGAETPQQLELLRAMGCDRAQSFLLAGPAPAESIQALLAQPSAPQEVFIGNIQ